MEKERITIAQAQDLYRGVIHDSSLFGIEPALIEEIDRLYKEIGKAVCEENGVVWGIPNKLSKDTALGERSRKAFFELQALVSPISGS